MPIYKNVSGTWTVVKHIYKKVGGTWTKVRRAFRNSGGVWTQYHGDNDFTAYSLGLLENRLAVANGGLWVNGAQKLGPVRSYSLVTFDKYGNIVFQRSYDIFGESSGGSPTSTPYGSAQLSADVSAMAAGTNFIVVTFDEPASGVAPVEPGVTNPPIAAAVNALLALGASSSILNGIQYRGAYLLLGTKGVGKAAEIYAGTYQTGIGTGGTDSGTLDGAIGITFNIVNGAISNVVRTL
ncbi:hypothetical protein [Burkholderia phage FLC9]|nr:hypothetical protein [Burkholderia phage FLC9]